MPRARDSLSLRAYGASHGRHDHPWHQLIVGLQGTLELEVEGRARRVAAGDAFLVPAGGRHDFESGAGSHCLVLDSDDPLWRNAARCHESQGMGPQEWLRLPRLAPARQSRDIGLLVNEVARRTGYRSPSALTAALRRSGS